MAKIKHNNFIDTVDGVLSGAKKEGILHLYAEGGSLAGRTITVKGREMLHFGTTGYLGLEQDPRLKQAAIGAIQNYGTQFPLSKSYISHPLYAELEHKVEQMYGIPPIIMKNSTLGHLAVIPTLVRDEDAVILDHQVHWSVQNACQLLKLRGIPIEMVRHNNLEMLEDTLRKLSGKAGHIWYMADGVYSMYGDYAPINELLELGRRYPQLRLYFDDVHGMSWIGKNGTGFVFDRIGELPENIVVVSTLSKTFGASGATFFCSDPLLRDKIKNFGGPLTFSAQLEPASVAAAIASADIHLSPEINILQDGLAKKTRLFASLLAQGNLPLLSQNDSPVFFLGMGSPDTAFRFMKRLYEAGFYLNLGIYPAVPIKNTGIRITLSSHNTKDDIISLAAAVSKHFPPALEETGTNEGRIRKAFRMEGAAHSEKTSAEKDTAAGLGIEKHETIHQIDRSEWDLRIGKHNILNWDGLDFLERAFRENPTPENRLDFHYYTVRDTKGEIVLTSFLTCGTWKDDLVATESVSRHLEKIRQGEPLHMTSKVLSMGSLFTEGQHFYIEGAHPLAKDAMLLLLQAAEALYEKLGADMLVLRDFEHGNPWDAMIGGKGYFRSEMPESCVLQDLNWKGTATFAQQLSPRSRRHFKQDIAPFGDTYEIEIKATLDKPELERALALYRNVHDRNLAINTFPYGSEVFEAMNNSPGWEFLLLYLKEQPDTPFAGIMFCYRNEGNAYIPELIGMDYEAGQDSGLYRQLLFQTIRRAGSLGFQRVDFGLSASFEKKKLGAIAIPKIAYVQARDNFSMERMHTLQNELGTRRL